MQAGLEYDEAVEALMLGARFWFHGFTQGEVDDMIRWQYSEWVRIEEEVERGRSRPAVYREWWNLKKRGIIK